MCVSPADVPLLHSRSADSNGAGKCDARLDTPLPESVKNDLAAVAVVLGFGSVAELNRRIIEDFLYGQLHAVRMAVRRSPVDGRNVGSG
jgi:hypothetical protein